MYSDFLHECKISEKMEDATAKFFHTAVTSVVGMYRHCLDQFTFRRCVYNETLRQTAETVSLFTIFIVHKCHRPTIQKYIVYICVIITFSVFNILKKKKTIRAGQFIHFWKVSVTSRHITLKGIEYV